MIIAGRATRWRADAGSSDDDDDDDTRRTTYDTRRGRGELATRREAIEGWAGAVMCLGREQRHPRDAGRLADDEREEHGDRHGAGRPQRDARVCAREEEEADVDRKLADLLEPVERRLPGRGRTAAGWV